MSSIPRPHRRGFTMVELLVVIAIIVLLMSLTVGAMFSFIAGARESATATTIVKVNQQLQERIANFRQMDFTDAAQLYASQPANAPMSLELAEVIVRKFRMKRAFPQNLTEINNDPQRFSALSVLNSPPAGYVSKFESGIVLYALLVNGETFGAPSATDDLFSSSEIRISTETANLPCLVDAWGEPLRFYRWPTRLFRPNGNGSTVDRTYARLLVASVGPVNGFGADGLPGTGGAGGVGAYGSDDVPNNGPDGQPGIAGAGPLGAIGSDDYEPLNVDADDSLLLLYSYLTVFAKLTVFEQGTPSVNLSQALHTPATYNPMLIISAGPDRQLGLFEPSDATNFGYLACPTISTNGAALTAQQLTDNLTNLNLSGSGK